MASETKTSDLLCPCDTCWLGDRLALETVVQPANKRHNTNLGKCFTLACLLLHLCSIDDPKAVALLWLACVLQVIL